LLIFYHNLGLIPWSFTNWYNLRFIKFRFSGWCWC